MNKIMTQVVKAHTAVRMAREERGAAMAEYGLLLALIALGAIAILVLFGGEINEVFTEAEAEIDNRGTVAAD